MWVFRVRLVYMFPLGQSKRSLGGLGLLVPHLFGALALRSTLYYHDRRVGVDWEVYRSVCGYGVVS